MVFPSAFLPRSSDPILQILHGKLEGSKDIGELKEDYQFLLDRDMKIKSEDRAAYNIVCKRFREKLGVEVFSPPSQRIVFHRVEVKKAEQVTPLPKPPALPKIDPSAYKVEICSRIESLKVQEGEQFICTWEIKNTGELPLPATCKLKSYASNNLVIDPNSTVCFNKEILFSDGKIPISKALRAPHAPGRYFDYFIIILPTGQEIGPLLQCQIEIERGGNLQSLPQEAKK